MSSDYYFCVLEVGFHSCQTSTDNDLGPMIKEKRLHKRRLVQMKRKTNRFPCTMKRRNAWLIGLLILKRLPAL